MRPRYEKSFPRCNLPGIGHVQKQLRRWYGGLLGPCGRERDHVAALRLDVAAQHQGLQQRRPQVARDRGHVAQLREGVDLAATVEYLALEADEEALGIVCLARDRG